LRPQKIKYKKMACDLRSTWTKFFKTHSQTISLY